MINPRMPAGEFGQTDSQGGEDGTPRRASPRYPLDRPMIVVPVLPDGSANPRHRTFGTGRDISVEGIGMQFQREGDLGPAMVVGVEESDGSIRYEGIQVRHEQKSDSDHVDVGGRFAGIGHEILQSENLVPVLNHESLEIGPRFGEEVLQSWVDMGVMRPVWLDRVQLCPRCHGLPLMRPGCTNCGSARVVNDQLAHHFACAHVGPIRDFEVNGELVCPKCRQQHLVVGTDYEQVIGPNRCLDCHWSDIELEQIGQCLRCGLRFPGYQAFHQDLRGYDVERLDPLALLPAP